MMTSTPRTARVRKWFRPVAAILVLVPLLLLAPLLGRGQGKTTEEQSLKKDGREAGPPPMVEVRFTDDSTLKLTLRDKGIWMTTRYGRVLVPAGDIRYIDFATRIPRAVVRRVDAAVANLGNRHYTVRQTAGAELLELREQAYPALLRACKDKDLEIARRAEEVLKQLTDQVPADQLMFRKDDVVRTVDSCLTGRIDEKSIKASTYQFGEVQLNPGHIRRLHYVGVDSNPNHVETLRGVIGKCFRFKVTGAEDGPVYGNGVYTSHSALGRAAVHAGVLKVGQTDVVRVTFVAPPAGFPAVVANGVTSSACGPHGGAYTVSR
jgi:hypothetical protein